MNFVKQVISIVFLGVVGAVPGLGQDQVLFHVEEEPVLLDEFLYIYQKTNRDQADFARASVEEYLDLYKKFKLKVYKARQMKLDTIVSLQQELQGYRKQLANTYLSDQGVVDDLTEEAYARMREDKKVRHILLNVPTNASKQQEDQIYQKGLNVLQRLRDGENMEKLALELSDDPNVRQNRGDLGYITAMLPDGFYNLESTIYSIPERTFSRPVKSKLGYHIVRVDNTRAARGEMEVSQILIRNQRGVGVKTKIDSLSKLLEEGADFGELAKKHSEDKATASQGGYLGFFGINKYESTFENAAFRLQTNGEISRPVRSSIGWHIIKRISHRPIPPFEEIQRSLQSKVKAGERFKVAENAVLERIKDENGFDQREFDKSMLLADMGDDLLDYRWKAPKDYTNQSLFTIGSEEVRVSDLLSYLSKNTASRLRLNRGSQIEDALDELYDDFVESEIRAFQESQLEEKYPEFKALMREYSEGILLFEATKMKVWDKASEDTLGLEKFYAANPGKYLWPERALVETVIIHSDDPETVSKIMKVIPKKSGNKLIKKLNKKAELVQSTTVIRDKEDLDEGLTWGQNSMTPVQEENGLKTIKRVVQLIPPKPKSLEEARGYVIADYQDHLEKEWVASLMEEFEVRVNEEVLNSIIK